MLAVPVGRNSLTSLAFEHLQLLLIPNTTANNQVPIIKAQREVQLTYLEKLCILPLLEPFNLNLLTHDL